MVYCFSYLNHDSYFSSYSVDCCGNSDQEGESYQTREKSSWESGVHCCSTQQAVSEFNKTLAVAMENASEGKCHVLKNKIIGTYPVIYLGFLYLLYLSVSFDVSAMFLSNIFTAPFR